MTRAIPHVQPHRVIYVSAMLPSAIRQYRRLVSCMMHMQMFPSMHRRAETSVKLRRSRLGLLAGLRTYVRILRVGLRANIYVGASF